MAFTRKHRRKGGQDSKIGVALCRCYIVPYVISWQLAFAGVVRSTDSSVVRVKLVCMHGRDGVRLCKVGLHSFATLHPLFLAWIEYGSQLMLPLM